MERNLRDTPIVPVLSPRAKSLLEGSIVWDNHSCMPLRADESFLPQLERFRKVGVNVVSLNVGFAEMPWEEHIRVLSFMRHWIAKHPAAYRLVHSVEDIQRAKAEGKLGVFFDVEGMCPVQDQPWLVQTFYELGVRWMLIAYNKANKAGAGCMDEKDGGLTPLGRQVIDEMERVGMLLCVTHTGARTAADALDYARNPVIFSHSNPLGVTQHPRNISDDLMRKCAAKGGVIGTNGIGKFLGAEQHNIVEQVLKHLRYAIDVVGPAHVGLGMDYVFDQEELKEFYRKNPGLFPPGLSNASSGLAMVAPEAMTPIVEGLARTNLSDDEIRGILGGNWMRVAKQVWK
jgi:membrane dipeptidase